MPRFCTAIHEGEPCTVRALPGHRFCYGHHPNPPAFRQCEYFNRFGRQCRAAALRAHDHCFTHSPRNLRSRREPIPLVPRTRRQKAAARWFTCSNLPQLKTALSEDSQCQ